MPVKLARKGYSVVRFFAEEYNMSDIILSSFKFVQHAVRPKSKNAAGTIKKAQRTFSLLLYLAVQM